MPLILHLAIGLPALADVIPETQQQDAVVQEVDKILAPFSKEVSDCLKKLDEWLPRVVIPSSELALEKVSILPGHEASSLHIPLKQPRGSIALLRQATRDLEGALQLLHLLQAGKVGSVTVDSYDNLFIADRPAKRLSRQDISACEKSKILTAVKGCTVCTITEWNNIKP
jgi:hypothetical protein